MRLRDLSPAILTSVFLLFVPTVWKANREDADRMLEVDARIIQAQEYRCSGSVRRSTSHGRCWELVLEYKAADGSVRRKIDYSNVQHQAGEWTSVLINVGEPGSVPEGADPKEAGDSPVGYTLFAFGMFAIGCYASLLRVRARRKREMEAAPQS